MPIIVMPTGAAPAQPPTNLPSDIIYTSRGEFVQVSPMRQLTLNAHIDQFAYEPLGIEVALVGSEVQGDQTVHFVKTMDMRSGREMNRLTVTAPSENNSAGFHLLGWSDSRKYLLLERFTPALDDAAASTRDYLRWDLSVDPPVTRPIDPAAHVPAAVSLMAGLGDAFPSPNRRWLVFRPDYPLPGEGKTRPQQTAYVRYDVERDTYQLLSLPPGFKSYRWSDDNHLRIYQGEDVQQLDVVSGQVSPLIAAASAGESPRMSKQYPDLKLDAEPRIQEDTQGSGGYLDSWLVWIRRTPAGKLPLGVAAAGLTPGDADPQAAWSPTGRQIAFLLRGDLWVTDLKLSTEHFPAERMAVGLTLTCADERQLAVSNLKQIGLAIIQYAQNNEEHLPPSAGINDAIFPYLKTRKLFQVGEHPFVYLLPGGISLASMENPAETEEGMIDLPCARVVLMADGHVKSFPKPDAP